MRNPVWNIVPALAVLAALGVAPAARAETVVRVTLQDDSDGGGGMRINADPASVKAGPMTILATNRSKAMVHEMIVARLSGRALPYDPKAGGVNESRINRLGEVSDLRPDASGSLHVTLKPGVYVLFCNQPGHYKAGMWTGLVVNR